MQESLAAAGITPGGKAPASDFIAAIKQGCGVSPQLACHYGSSDAEEVGIPDCITHHLLQFRRLETEQPAPELVSRVELSLPRL